MNIVVFIYNKELFLQQGGVQILQSFIFAGNNEWLLRQVSS